MIVPLTITHALAVAADLRPWDRREIAASVGHDDFPRWAAAVLAMPGLDAVAVLHGDQPVAMGGAVVDGTTATTWFVGTAELPCAAVLIHRAAIRLHRRLAVDVRRFVAHSLDGHRQGRAWLERLGYRPALTTTHNDHRFTLMARECTHG